ncbi:MAG: hypothetical protein HWD82_09310 [Flavobacteriaceae bacterium]|nr:hypothetical protein [Flavobacteriaceae bacterium]
MTRLFLSNLYILLFMVNGTIFSQELKIIPQPNKVSIYGDFFYINNETKIVFDSESKTIANQLKDYLNLEFD